MGKVRLIFNTKMNFVQLFDNDGKLVKEGNVSERVLTTQFSHEPSVQSLMYNGRTYVFKAFTRNGVHFQESTTRVLMDVDFKE